jgi:hypothetical protein
VMDKKFYVVGGGAYDDTGNINTNCAIVEVYDFVAKQWHVGPALPEFRRVPFVTALNGRLYVAGGTVSTNVGSVYRNIAGLLLTNCYVAATSLLTLASNAAAWKTLAPMPAPRFQGDGAQVLNGRIWVIGGCTYELNGGAVHAEVFIYNPKLNSWISSK